MKKLYDKLPEFLKDILAVYSSLFLISLFMVALLIPVAVLFGTMPPWVLKVEGAVIVIAGYLYFKN